MRAVFLTDVPGVLDANKQLIPTLTATQARGLIETGVVSGGMIPKVTACLAGLSATTASCVIDGRQAHALLRELFTETGFGTLFTLD
jgi:acetylglutamate kinase